MGLIFKYVFAMKYKILKKIVFIIAVIIFGTTINSCRKPSSICGTSKATYTGVYKFNEIGILGADSSNAYIEVQYTISNGNTNHILTQWVKSPCLIGGYPVNCNYDSIYTCSSGQVSGILLRPKIGYGMGNAEFMKIINHSNNIL